MRKPFSFARILAAWAGASLVLVQPLRVDALPTFSWQGLGGNTSVATADNWDNEGSTPSGGENFVFGDIATEASHTVQIPDFGEGATTVANLQFNGTGPLNYTFTGTGDHPGLFVNGDVSVETAGTVTFENSLKIGLSYSGTDVTVASGATLAVQGVIYGDDGGGSIAKYGAGTLTLSGQNTFNGLSVHGGTVIAGASSDSGITSGSLGRSWLKFYDGSTLAAGGAAITLYNQLELDCRSEATVTFDSSSGQVLTLRGQITGESKLAKTGAGTLVLANSGNSFDGDVDVQGGTLQVAANSDLEMHTSAIGWDNTLKLHDGTTLQKEETIGNVTLFNDMVLDGESVTVDTGASSEFSLRGQISGSATLVKVGTGYLSLGDADGGGYSSTSNNNFSGGVKVMAGTLILGSSSYVEGDIFGPVGSGTLTLKNGTALRTATGAGDITLHNDIALDTTASTTVAFGTEEGDLSLEGNISGAAKIVKEGGETLTLSGNNTFTGGIEVKAGTLEVDHTNGTGTGVLALSASNAVSVEFNRGTHTIGGLSGGNSEAEIGLRGETGTILTINQAANSTYSGTIDGGSDDKLVKTGAGTLELAGNNGTFNGTMLLKGGTLSIAADTALGSVAESVQTGRLVLDGGTLRTTANITIPTNRGITLYLGGGTFSPDTATSLTYGGVITGGEDGGLTKSGAGTLVLTGANTYEGSTKIMGGVLSVNTLANGGTASSIGQSGNSAGNLSIDGGTLRYTGSSFVITDRLFSIGANATIEGSGSNGVDFSNTGTIGLIGSGAHTLTLGGTHTGNILYPVLADKDGANLSSLIKQDAGTWILSTPQTYTGATTIMGGTLRMNTNNALSSATVVTVNSGGTLALGTSNLAIAGLSGLGTVSMNAPEAGNTYLDIGGTNASSAFSGVISGSGTNGLVKSGTGMLTLSGANSYGGGTGINAGTLRIANGAALGSGAVTVAADATLDLHHTLTVGAKPLTVSGTGVGGAGAFISSDGQGTWLGTVALFGSNVNVGGAGTLEISGIVSGTGSLTKVGTGNLILNAANTYSGGTVIKQGNVNANHATALGTGSVTFEGGSLNVASGITLANSLNFSSGTTVLAGNGTFGSHVTADSHVVLSPGNSPGTLTFNAGLTLATGSAISFQVQDTTAAAGAGWDLISVSNGLALTATANTITLNILFLDSSGNAGLPVGFNSANDYSWTLASSSTPITGFSANQFHLVTEGPTGPFGFTVSKSTDGLSLLVNYSPTFAPVPEPSTWALFALGLGSLGLTLWRRRRA